MAKKGEKDFNHIWDIIEVSIYIMVGYSLLDLFFSISNYIGKILPAGIISVILILLAYGSIGYIGSNEKESPNKLAKYGAYSGVITGFASAIIGIITFYFFPEKIADALIKAAQSGADMSTVKSMMKIGIYINIILVPALYAGIGALVAWISALIFKKKDVRR